MQEKILKENLSQLGKILKNSSSVYWELINVNLQTVKDAQKALSKNVEPVDAGSDGSFAFQKKLHEHLLVFKDLISSAQMNSDSLLGQLPWNELLLESETPTKENSNQVSLPYLPIETTSPESGSVINRLRQKNSIKRYERYRLALESADTAKHKQRIFDPNLFNAYHITLPAANHLYNKWQSVLLFWSNALYQLHQASEDIKDSVINAPEMSPQNSEYWQTLKQNKSKQALESYLTVTGQVWQQYQEIIKQQTELDETFLKQLEQKIKDAYDIAGSPLLPTTRFSETAIQKKWNLLDQKYRKSNTRWLLHLNGTINEFQKDLEISGLQLIAVEMYEHTLAIVENKLLKKILPQLDQIGDDLSESLDTFEQADKVEEDELRREILAENRALVKLLRQQKLPELVDTLNQAGLVQTFKGFFNRIEDEIEKLTDSHIIFIDRDNVHSPPDSKTDEVPLKELIDEEIFANSRKTFNKLEESLSDRLETIVRKISSLDQIVEFNLNAAYNLLKEENSAEGIIKAREIAVSGLERTKGKLEELKDELNDAIKESIDQFNLYALQFECDLQELADSKKILELKLRLAKARSKEKIIETRNKGWARVKSFVPSIYRVILKSTQKVRDSIFELRRVTRLGPAQMSDSDLPTRFLIETYQKIKKMPYIYQRLFRLDPLEEKRFFHGRDKMFTHIKEDFEGFKEGYPAMTAIVGEKGNGKTTLLKFCEKEIFSGYTIITVDCQNTIYNLPDFLSLIKEPFNLLDIQSLDELEAHLQNTTQKYICIFENIQNLFLRVTDGFELIERFLLLISNTRANIFWIVTSGLYAWQYLDRVLTLSDNFKSTVYLESLSIEDLKHVIFTRHQVSGYGIHFEEPKKMLKSRQYKKLNNPEAKQAYLKARFFEELSEITGGNIKAAINYWLSAIESFEEEKINISAGINIDDSFLLQLSAEEYFTLAALIQHEYLNPKQHAMVFNQELDTSLSILGRLYKKGFLDRADGKYSVHSYFYRPVVKTLKSKNILN